VRPGRGVSRTARARSERFLAQQRRFLARLGSPVSACMLVSAGQHGKGVTGRVYISAGGRSAGLVAAGLPQAGAGVYQLWAIADGSPRPLESFRPEPGGTALVPVDLGPLGPLGPLGRGTGPPSFAVTLEPRPANAVPEGPVVLQPAQAW
jgi:hypothetical protein